MEIITGLILSPILFVGLFLLVKLKFHGKDEKLLVQAFIWGLVLTLPVTFIDQVAHYFEVDGARSIRRMIAYSFIAVAFTSELSKFIPLRFSLVNKLQFRSPSDGIFYSIAVSLGMASIYAVYYHFFSARSGVDPAYFLSIGPMNVLLGIILGFFIGLGKIRKNLFIDSMTGLGAAMLFHGIYRFILLSKDLTLFGLFVIGSLFVAVVLVFKSRGINAES